MEVRPARSLIPATRPFGDVRYNLVVESTCIRVRCGISVSTTARYCFQQHRTISRLGWVRDSGSFAPLRDAWPRRWILSSFLAAVCAILAYV